MRPAIGVLITYFGERQMLGECLDSLLSGPDIPEEIIVHDDASEAPAMDYLPGGVRVSVIRAQTNQGPARSRNTLLRAAHTDFVHFHDADDLFTPMWCLRVREALERSAHDAVFTEVSSVYQGRVFADQVVLLSRLRQEPDLVRFCLSGAMLVPAGTYRREVVQAIGGYREALWQAEDFDFHVRLAASGISYAVLDEPLVVIRLRTESRSQKQIEVWTSALQAIEHLAEELPMGYRPDLSDTAARAGSILFKLGAPAEARRAFRLARHLGRPRFSGQGSAYRFIARRFSPEVAERVAAGYRAVFPHSLRARISGW